MSRDKVKEESKNKGMGKKRREGGRLLKQEERNGGLGGESKREGRKDILSRDIVKHE